MIDNSPISWWYNTLCLYCGRRLTFVKDALPAIAGIALKVNERSNYITKQVFGWRTSTGACYGKLIIPPED